MLALSGLPDGCFAYQPRSARYAGCVVLVVPVASALSMPGGVGAFLRGLGCTVQATKQADFKQKYVGVLLSCPVWVAESLLSLPRPVSHGSLSVHAALPW